jgi:diadenylate cyclase
VDQLEQNCDFSPLKIQLKEYLTQVSTELQTSLASLDNENYCLLSEFAQIGNKFIQVESMAASFYLKCYLAPYTNKYIDLSICIQHLSERRHGALIVIQREDTLGEFIQQGIPIHATFTYSLLESIFYPGSPLHDGAVLIQGDNITSAGHVLPLSSIYVGEKKLGTRHRAAIGLSEKSDALIITVSEETGIPSFALAGKLYPFRTLEQSSIH